MTTKLAATGAALTIIALLLTGCTSSPTETDSSSDLEEFDSGSDGGSVSIDGEVDEDTPAPGDEICVHATEFEKIDALLIKANRENPPATSYRDAMYQMQAVIPVDTIGTDWQDLRHLLEEWVPIVESGDSDAIADSADLVTDISEIHLRLFGYFSTYC